MDLMDEEEKVSLRRFPSQWNLLESAASVLTRFRQVGSRLDEESVPLLFPEPVLGDESQKAKTPEALVDETAEFDLEKGFASTVTPIVSPLASSVSSSVGGHTPVPSVTASERIQSSVPSFSSPARIRTPISSSSSPARRRTPDDDRASTYEKVLVMGGHIISTTAAILDTNCMSGMSRKARGLLYFLIGCIFVSLLAHFYALFFAKHRRCAQFFRALTIIATAWGLVAATGLHMPEDVVFWVTIVALVISSPAIFGYAYRTVY